MTSTAPKPTIVVIPGGWHTPYHYAPLLEALQQKGYPTRCHWLPTCNPSIQPTATFWHDVQVVRSVVEEMVERGLDVFVVGHSSGSFIGGEALHGLEKKRDASAAGQAHEANTAKRG
ncbi:MAG: hypothetical protein Q9190_005424, partial [Brigantiaea leucoxantha]